MAVESMRAGAGQAAQTETTPSRAPRRIVLCLDGTWNGAFDETKRRDGQTVLKPTNPLKLCRAVKPFDDKGVGQIAYYAIGVGSLSVYPGTSNWLLHHFDRILGGAFGAGFEGNVEDALHFLTLNYEPGDEVYIFGFSRGAGTARAVTKFLEWNRGVPQKGDAYYLPLLFREYLRVQGGTDDRQYERFKDKLDDENKKRPQKKPLERFTPVTVRYLGVWDTVMALGSRLNSRGANTSSQNRAFFAGDAPASCVKRARQALAIDERRFDFRPEVWIKALDGQEVEQRWFAGVHSNVGGGYLHDGLANVAFHWVMNGAEKEGLQVDHAFADVYEGGSLDSLYQSSTPFYQVFDLIRNTVGRGERELHGFHADLSPSVIERMRAKPSEVLDSERQPSSKPYRPENVLRFLAAQPNLDSYLQEIGLKNVAIKDLPEDVQERIKTLRATSAAIGGARP